MISADNSPPDSVHYIPSTPTRIAYYDGAMKIHELLTPEHIKLDFAPSPGQELKALISLACSQVGDAAMDTCRFQEDELHLVHEYLSAGLAILHNLAAAAGNALPCTLTGNPFSG
jgi:hypothetical protein